MNGRIAILLPSRGRPASLERALDTIGATTVRPDDVVVVVGVDDDDAATRALSARLRTPVALLWSVGPPEMTLGRLWNRLAMAEHGCDLLAMFTDDYAMATPGWDDRYREAAARMPMGCGVAWPQDPLHGADICSLPVITRPFMERMGFFVPPWFPFWFHDVWLEEMGAFVGCLLPLAARVTAPGGRGSTQHMRDLPFWARLFDATRPQRIALADSLLDEIHAGQPALRDRSKHAMSETARSYRRRNRKLASPFRAAIIERLRGARSGPPGPRYLAALREAQALLASLEGAAP
jgi:hypothetical protein